MGGFWLVLIALLPAGSEEPVRPPRPGLSWAQAESLERKLDTIEKRKPGDQTGEEVLVTQGELNSYLNLSLAPELPTGVTDLDVRLERDRITARALVDLGQVREKMPSPGPLNPASYLSGQVPVEIRGRYSSPEEGFGLLEIEDIRLATLPVPVSFLEQLVTSLTRTRENPKGFDVQAPFRLPYSVKRLRLLPGRAFLEL